MAPKRKPRPPAQCSLLQCGLCCLFCCGSLLLIIFLFYTSIYRDPPVGVNLVSFRTITMESRTVSIFGQPPHNERQWIAKLRNGAVERVIPIPHNGLAAKQVLMLEGGYAVMVKPMIHSLLFLHSWIGVWDWDDVESSVFFSVRMDRMYQGWGEVAGYHLDRALEFFLKPPTASRYLSNKLLYQHGESATTRLLRLLPTHQVPLSVTAWVDELRTVPPNRRMRNILRIEDKSEEDDPTVKPPPSFSVRVMKTAAEYSDVLVFDFLADDYDRMGSHNWKESRGKVLAWDSGLAFNYGPKHFDLDLLCGTHEWNPGEDLEHDVHREGCQRICAFRRATVERLRSMNSSSSNPIGDRFCSNISRSNILPLFQHGIFSVWRRYWFPAAVSFLDKNYCDGVTLRTDRLLEHIDGCMEEYGEERVLIDIS